VHPAEAQRRYPQKVICQAIDQLRRWAAEAAGVVPPDSGRKLSLVDQACRRVEHGDQQLAMLVLERAKRRAHCIGRGGQLSLDHRH
jgi:hypothetical protein